MTGPAHGDRLAAPWESRFPVGLLARAGPLAIPLALVMAVAGVWFVYLAMVLAAVFLQALGATPAGQVAGAALGVAALLTGAGRWIFRQAHNPGGVVRLLLILVLPAILLTWLLLAGAGAWDPGQETVRDRFLREPLEFIAAVSGLAVVGVAAARRVAGFVAGALGSWRGFLAQLWKVTLFCGAVVGVVWLVREVGWDVYSGW